MSRVIGVVMLMLASAASLVAQQAVTGSMRLTWEQPATTLPAAQALVVKTYLDPPPQGPQPAAGIVRPFVCIGTASPFTCQLTVDAATLINGATGVHVVAISVQTKNADGSLTQEVFADTATFRVDVAAANKPINLRFAAALP